MKRLVLLAVIVVFGNQVSAINKETRFLRQPPVFRAGVDLVALDVQAVDGKGQPVADLTPADFEVSLKGKARRVVSADFIRYDATESVTAAARAAAPVSAPPSATHRVILLAIDAASFDQAQALQMTTAARSFVDHLPAASEVGLVTFPVGPLVDPTANHTTVRQQLTHVSGQAMGFGGEFSVTPSDIIDVTARDEVATSRVERQSCGTDLQHVQTQADVACINRLHAEIDVKALAYESEAIGTIQTFGSVLEAVGRLPGRKIVVLLSAGAPTSDRQDGRPQIGDLPQQLGERATRANATVYTLYLDDGFFRKNAAAEGQNRMRNGVGNFIWEDRDTALQSQWLDLFAGASGGVLMPVSGGSGENQFDRILSETSAYYLLGIEPAPGDRDGLSHELNVKVMRKGVNVRSRAWATMPRSTP